MLIAQTKPVDKDLIKIKDLDCIDIPSTSIHVLYDINI